jgi:hypothetical protein
MSGLDSTAPSANLENCEVIAHDIAPASESLPISKQSDRWLNLRKRLPHVCYHLSSACAICRWLSEHPESL